MWVLEYSVSQDCFNIDTLERVLEMNVEAMKAKMSNDYKIAIEEGTNIVRIGTKVFGKRSKK